MTLEDKMCIKPIRRARKRPSLRLNRNADGFLVLVSQSNLHAYKYGDTITNLSLKGHACMVLLLKLVTKISGVILSI
mgnify:FL=1